ncbi:hypothetical protein SUGI_0932760 [Cryptomeria japonica]|nr:hypothetical protein SUGI_0932760 [Cryptomeria japonica]
MGVRVRSMMMTLSLYHLLHVLEVGDIAWNSDPALVLKSIFFLGFLQKLLEERVVYVCNGYHTALLFLSLPNGEGKVALGHFLVKLLSFLPPQLQ